MFRFNASSINRGSKLSFEIFFKSPLSCLGLARWLPANAGDVARKFKRSWTLKFIDIECFCWSVMPALKTPMINAGMVFTDRHAGGINYPKGVGTIAEKFVSGIEKLGGKVRYKANVTEILLKDKKAVGVKLKWGRYIQISLYPTPLDGIHLDWIILKD